MDDESKSKTDLQSELAQLRQRLDELENNPATLWTIDPRYRLLAENAADVLWIFDVAGDHFSFATPALKRLVGYTAQERLNQGLARTVTPASLAYFRQVVPGRVERLLQGHDEFYTDEVELIHRDGHIVFTEATMRFGINPTTGKIEVLGISRDITERKRAQESLRQTQLSLAKAEERERMASELHDNLGQVLSYLALNAQAIRDLIEQNNLTAALGQLDALSMAAQSANRNVREYILDMKTSFTATQGFTDVLKLYLARLESITGLATQLSLPADSIDTLLPASAYVNVLRIIQEALANARKHAQATQAHVIFTLTTNRLQVVISDNGRGFEVNDAHVGFGLDIMRERAQQANGKIEIRSELGHGTQVILELARTQADTVRAQLAGMRVLLVDDHALFIEGIKNVLTGRNVTVAGVAYNGDQAIQLAGALKPDLVLLDVHLPGQAGPELIQPIKQASPTCQVVMLSMSAEDDALVESLRQGASGYLLKSQPPAEFFDALVALRHGETPLAPGLANRLAMHIANPTRSTDARARQTLLAAGLSALQVDILAAMAQGEVYKMIAANLHITESAVKYHAERIQSILKVADRSAAIAMAYQVGLIPDRRTPK